MTRDETERLRLTLVESNVSARISSMRAVLGLAKTCPNLPAFIALLEKQLIPKMEKDLLNDSMKKLDSETTP